MVEGFPSVCKARAGGMPQWFRSRAAEFDPRHEHEVDHNCLRLQPLGDPVSFGSLGTCIHVHIHLHTHTRN